MVRVLGTGRIVARSSGRAERFLGQGNGSVCDVELMYVRFSLQSNGLYLLQDQALFLIHGFLLPATLTI